MYNIFVYMCIFHALLLLSMWIKASNILFKSNRSNNKQTFFLQATKIEYFESDFQILDILSKFYQNSVFTIAYYRVLFPGKHLKLYGIKAIYKISILFLLNYILFWIQTVKFLFSSKNTTLFQVWYLNFNNSLDNRKLIFLNNSWHTNPGSEKNIANAVKNYINIDKTQLIYNNDIHEVIFKTKNALKNINPTPEYINTYNIFFKKNSKISHIAMKNLLSSENNNIHYITDIHKAINNNFYNKISTIPIFEGPKKLSTILPFNDEIFIEQGSLKIPLDSIGFAIFKNNHSSIIQHLPDNFIPNYENFNKNIKNNIDIIHYKWSIFEKNIEHLNLTDDQAFELFQQIINNI